MKKQLTILVFGALSASLFAGTVPKSIMARYSGIESAMRKLDADAFSKYISDDFWSIDPKGQKQNKADFIKSVREIFTNAKTAKPMVEFKGSKMHDGMVDVMFDFHLTVMMKGGGKATVHEVGTDTWKKVGGQWLCCKTVDKVLDIKMPKVKSK